MTAPGLGLRAGAAGTLVVSAFARLERALLGRDPVYAPRRMLARVAKRLPVRRPGREVLDTAGLLLRWTYGPGLGLAWGQVRPKLPASGLLRGAALGTALFAAEAATLPRLGMTPRFGRWPWTETALLAAHSLAYGWTTELVYRRLLARQPTRLKRPPGFYEREPPPLRPQAAGSADLRG